jgi:hypothetical protein
MLSISAFSRLLILIWRVTPRVGSRNGEGTTELADEAEAEAEAEETEEPLGEAERY